MEESKRVPSGTRLHCCQLLCDDIRASSYVREKKIRMCF